MILRSVQFLHHHHISTFLRSTLKTTVDQRAPPASATSEIFSSRGACGHPPTSLPPSIMLHVEFYMVFYLQLVTNITRRVSSMFLTSQRHSQTRQSTVEQITSN
jgi:hypothetical protein